MRNQLCLGFSCVLALQGCFGATQGGADDGGTGGATASGGDSNQAGSGGMRVASGGVTVSGGSDRALPEPSPQCGDGVEVLDVGGHDKVDVLFVIDSSRSMLDEQEKLRAEILGFVERLTTGQSADGSAFPPARDIHLGVITTDMGVPGLAAPLPENFQCSSYGDDGILRTGPGPLPADGPTAWAPTCAGVPGNPTFIAYRAGGPLSATAAAEQLDCLVQVGPGGCGFEAQLEAPLKALWPALDIDPQTGKQWLDPATGQQGNRVTFLSDQPGQVTYGHGDGANNGFLRNDPQEGTSVVAVVLVTDEEDCSPRETDFLNYPALPGTPYEGVPPNLLCMNFPDKLWPTERFVHGLQALRPGNEDQVIFAAIAGVPQYLVTAERLGAIDFSKEGARADFYNTLKQDPNMAPTLRADAQNINFSCQPSGAGPNQGAYPPLRILDVVEKFGASGVIGSICEDDFSTPFDALTARIGAQLGEHCLDGALVPDGEGLVGAQVVWELPRVAPSPAAPTRCEQRDFLMTPASEAAMFTDDGRARCIVRQLPVQGASTPAGSGWYYDDFSDELFSCRGGATQRIAFSDEAAPPAGVRVRLYKADADASQPCN